MIRFEKEYLPDKPIFLGTTQHALRLDSDVNILVGFKFNDEIRQVHNVKVKSYQLGKLPKLGAALPIGEITGTALSGYKAELIQNYDDSFEENFENDFSRLVDIKNISNYQILKGNDDMTDLTKSPDLTSQNIARLREIFGLSQLEFANKVGVGKRTIQYIENGKQKISKNVNISYLNKSDYIISMLLPNITQKYKNIKTNLLPIFFEDVEWEKVLDKDQINKLIERIIINSDYIFLGNVLSKINVKNLNINSDINPLWKHIKDEKILETLINNGVDVDLKKLYIELKSKINNMYSERQLINWLDNNIKESEKNYVKGVIDNNFNKNKLNDLYYKIKSSSFYSDIINEIKTYENWKDIVFEGNKNIFMAIAHYQPKTLNYFKEKKYFQEKLKNRDDQGYTVLDYYLRSSSDKGFCSVSMFNWLLKNDDITLNKEMFLDIKANLRHEILPLVRKYSLQILIGENIDDFYLKVMDMLNNNNLNNLTNLAKNMFYLYENIYANEIEKLPKPMIGFLLIFNKIFESEEQNIQYRDFLLNLRPELINNYHYSEHIKNKIGEDNYILMEKNTLKNVAHKNTSLVTKKRL